MSDAVSIASLKDFKTKIEGILEKVKKNLSKFDTADPSEQRKIPQQNREELSLAQIHLDSMKMEIQSLTTELLQKSWKDTCTQLKGEIKKNQELNNEKETLTRKKDAFQDDVNVNDPKNSDLTVQQAIDKGNRILAEDDKAIKRMVRQVKNDNDLANELKGELAKQEEKLGNVAKDLKEIDYSLKRAGEQLKTMFRMYATDKIILCLIVIIVLVIIAIIIVSAVGGDKEGKFNAPHDIFTRRLLFLKGERD